MWRGDDNGDFERRTMVISSILKTPLWQLKVFLDLSVELEHVLVDRE